MFIVFICWLYMGLIYIVGFFIFLSCCHESGNFISDERYIYAIMYENN